RHVLVAGATGSGKTTRVVEILNQLQDDRLSVVVFETAKRTYRNRFLRVGRNTPLVYSLGGSSQHSSSRVTPLRLNPFFFELGTSLKRHIAVLSDALADLMPTQAMIGPLMRRAIETAYVERGWDIEHGVPVSGNIPTWPTVLDFSVHVLRIAETLSYGPEVSANYRGALESRASLFLDATFQDVFSHGGNHPIDELFPPGQDAIVEVEDLPPSEVDIRAFVMTLLLNRLRSVQGRRDYVLANGTTLNTGNTGLRRWLIVIEEAHNVLDRSFEVRRPADESNAGRTLLRCIDRLLQEGREMELGVMVVDQSPTSLARSVISNTGTKIVMRLEDGAEMEEIGRAIGLEEDAWGKLGYLQEGEAIIKASYMDAPVKTARFVRTSPGPSSRPEPDEIPEGVRSPSYVTMTEIWCPVLNGTQAPDGRWLAAIMAASGGSVALAAFVGATVQMKDNANDVDGSERGDILRAVAAVSDVGLDGLLSAALKVHVAVMGKASQGPLVAVIRIMFRSLLEPAPDLVARAPALGIRRAADLLEMAGIGEARRWRALFLGLAGRVGDRWRITCHEYTKYCQELGRDVTAPIRVLILLWAQMARSAVFRTLTKVDADPIEVILQAQGFVDVVVGPLPEEFSDADLIRGRCEIAEQLAHELALDLADKAGNVVAASVRELLTGKLRDDD
ncbi:MAG: ATP-binding protein, partial [Sulfobacillus sp.]